MTIGPIRLMPYVRRCSPGDLASAIQSDIDDVLKAYSDRPRSIVKRATLIEVDDWHQGQDPTPVIERLFSAREAVAFAALSERNLFGRHFNYCCFDNFALTVQPYLEGSAHRFAYTTRRRDGSASNLWNAHEFCFQRPLHVHDVAQPTVDEELIDLLIGEVRPSWLEAVAEFNRANTDSNDVLPHVELVMMKSAFEFLFEIRETAQVFVEALDSCLHGLIPLPAQGPLSERWKNARPKTERPLHAWAREFCDRRGVAAHGRRGNGDRFVWSEWAHLAFAAMFFPLAFKKQAADAGLFEISMADLERLRRIDEYVLHDPALYDEDHQHPWAQIDSDVRLAQMAKRLYPD